MSVLCVTFFGATLLLIGQKMGNDLFKLRGQDSIFTIRTRRATSDSWEFLRGADLSQVADSSRGGDFGSGPDFSRGGTFGSGGPRSRGTR